jgi:hypothetical protein
MRGGCASYFRFKSHPLRLLLFLNSRDFSFELDLGLMDVDDKALSRVLKAKRDVALLEKFQAEPRTYVCLPTLGYYSKLLKDILNGVSCECCGFRDSLNVRMVEGHIVGPECAAHPFGSCKRSA